MDDERDTLEEDDVLAADDPLEEEDTLSAETEEDAADGEGPEDPAPSDDPAPEPVRANERSEPGRKPGRAERAVLEAKRLRREAEANLDKERSERIRIEAEFAQLRQQRDAQARRDQEDRRLLMSPEERAMEDRMNEIVQQTNQRMQAIQMQTYEQNDRLVFRQMLVEKPVLRRYEDAVEARVAEQARRGVVLSREAALKYEIGDAMMRSGGATRAKAAKSAARRVSAQKVSAPSARGGTAPARTARNSDPDSLEAITARLEGVFI